MNRIASYMLLGLLTITLNTPTLAMDTKKVSPSKSRVGCWEHCAIASTAVLVSSLCIALGFGTHTEIVRMVRDEQNPCLSVWGTNPNIGIFSLKPPLCDAHYDPLCNKRHSSRSS